MNVRPKNIKPLEENMSRKLLDINLCGDILHMTLKAEAAKAKINKWTASN